MTQSLRDILTKSGLLDSTDEGRGLQLYSWRCEQCGQRQHQLIPRGARPPVCVVPMCRYPLVSELCK